MSELQKYIINVITYFYQRNFHEHIFEYLIGVTVNKNYKILHYVHGHQIDNHALACTFIVSNE